AALAQLCVTPLSLGDIVRTDRDQGDAGRAVRVLRLRAARNAQVARREVLDEEGERWHEHRRPPFKLRPVGTRPPALRGRIGDEPAERGSVGREVVGEEREVREPAAVRSDLPPAMRYLAPGLVERDELQIAS